MKPLSILILASLMLSVIGCGDATSAPSEADKERERTVEKQKRDELEGIKRP